MKSRLVVVSMVTLARLLGREKMDKGWEWKWAHVIRKKDLVPWLGQQHTQQQ